MRIAVRGKSQPARAPFLLLKLGGELLEEPDRLQAMAAAIARLGRGHRLVVVHGGGREIDREMARHGIEKRAADGLRITDEATLEIVVGVLAGRVNTRLVAAAAAAGVRAVGLTGADAGVGRVRRAPPYQAADGSRVDLGFVGQPVTNGQPVLLVALCDAGYVPIIACIGADARGRLYNVNADMLAGHLAVQLRAAHLILAGATPGVLDAAGATIPEIDDATLDRLITSGGASAGMVAKLLACRRARRGGVSRVTIVDGRQPSLLERVLSPSKRTPATAVIAGRQRRVGRVAPNRTER
jgi:acetylglutamate kinase